MSEKSIRLLCKVVNIRSSQRKEAFELLQEDTEVGLELDGAEHTATLSNQLFQDFGSLSKKDMMKCFEAIASLNNQSLDNLFAWTVDCSAFVYDLQYVPSYSCYVSITLSVDDKGKGDIEENISDSTLDSPKSARDENIPHWQFDWDTWHSNYGQKEVISFSAKGVGFDNNEGVSIQDILRSMDQYEAVKLIPEPDNKYDPNAIAIHGASGMIGYVPKELTSEVKEVLGKKDVLIKGTVRCPANQPCLLIVDILIL